MSQHHGGQLDYHEGEEYFEKLKQTTGANAFGTELEIAADGQVIMKIALPDSGTNNATPLAAIEAIRGLSNDEVQADLRAALAWLQKAEGVRGDRLGVGVRVWR